MYVVLARTARLLLLVTLLFSLIQPTSAQSNNILRGKVTDPVGSAVSNAKIAALLDGKEVAHATSDAEGAFQFAVPDKGRYDVQVEAQGFASQTLPSVTADRTAASSEVTLAASLTTGGTPRSCRTSTPTP